MNASIRQVTGERGPGTTGLSPWLRTWRVAAIVASLMLSLSAAHAGTYRIADGRYSCTLSFMSVIGHIEVEDERYRTILRNGRTSDLYPIEIGDTGSLTLDGPVSLLSQNGLVLEGARMVVPQRSEFGFTLSVQTSSGAFHSVFCTTG